MEKFYINVNASTYEVRTPELKGNGNFEFCLFQADDLLLVLAPSLTKTNKIAWAPKVNFLPQEISAKYITSLGKAIEAHYLEA